MSSPAPWTVVSSFGLVLAWLVLILMQRTSLIQMYEHDTPLGKTQAVRKAHLLLRFFGPSIRAVFYSMHLAFISSLPERVILRFPGYTDIEKRSALLDPFSSSDLLLARLSTLVGLAFLCLLVVAG